MEFITIKADATVFEFNKGEGSFTGKTTVDQLKRIHEKIIAVLKDEDVHVLMNSKLLDIEKRFEKTKKAATDAASKGKRK